ncbi:TPA: hypothetical protein I9Z60_001610 [Clostridium perfringens]|nr:hypothetical protein [Clostridium perfringens]
METIIQKGVVLVGTTFIGETIKSVVKNYISPILEKHYKNLSKEKERELIEENIIEYLERSYKNNEYINTIVFKNQQKKLEDLYIPLTVVKHIENRAAEKPSIVIDKYDNGFLPLYKNILLVDSAGMGKSTIMKYLYLSSIKEEKGIPILIELRKLEPNTSIVDFIVREINGINGVCSREVILELIKGGDFIFFFDGYDEINLENKTRVTENIQDFISKAYNNNFIISSREEVELNSFGGFQRFDIKSLTKEEAYGLIKKYDNNGELSKELINTIENEENLVILKEFLENPLMVSLLYKAFEYNKQVPYKKHIFYKQVYDALFEQHDLSKGGAYKHIKKSSLDIDDFHKILRCIGFITLTKGINYSREELISLINKAKAKNPEIEFRASDFLWDIIHSVPLFTREGIEYKWVHKSFQEYFAASYLCVDAKKTQEKLLKEMSNNNKIYKYFNVLDFFYDMEYKQFSRYILLDLFKEYEIFYENSYNNKFFSDFKAESIDTRKKIQFILEKVYIRKFDEEDRNLDVYEIWKRDFEHISDAGKTTGTYDSMMVVNFGNNRKEQLLKLLKNKNFEGIKEYFCIEKNVNKKLYDILEFKVMYDINDDVNNDLNSYKNFEIVNEFLKKIIDIRFRYLLDYNICMKIKEQIEAGIREEENDLDFI